jgi:hypothetical protein
MHDKLETNVVTVNNVAILSDNIENLSLELKREIDDLQIDKMEVSEDNKQTLKQVRASLNKKLTSFENDRKKIKEIVLQPVVQFEEIYKTKLKSLFESTIKQLDDKIYSIEKGQIQEFEDYAREYFDRKLQSNPISVANTYEDVKLKINLTSNNKKIREEIDRHFEKILSALTIIESHQYSSRLRVLWEKETQYDIGIALVKLTTQISEEQKYIQQNEVQEKQKENIQVEQQIQSTHIFNHIPQELFDFTLRISLTEDQLSLLTEFMESHYIEYEVQEHD